MKFKPTEDKNTIKVDTSECECLHVIMDGCVVYIDSSMLAEEGLIVNKWKKSSRLDQMARAST